MSTPDPGEEEAKFEELKPEPPPPPSLPPADAASAAKPARGAIPKRVTVGERLQKSSKPPSKAGFVIKAILIFGVPIAIVGIIVSSFFIKVGKGDKRESVAMRAFRLIKIQLGMETAPGTAPPKVVKERHPNLVGFEMTCNLMLQQQAQLLRINRKLNEHDAAKPWEKEEVLKHLEDLEEVQTKIGQCVELFGKQAGWIHEYDELVQQAGAAYEEAKKANPDPLVAQQDPKFVELTAKLGRDKYEDVNIKLEDVNNKLRDATSVMKEVRRLRSFLPSRSMLEGKEPPPVPVVVKPPDPPPPPPAPKIEAPRTVHPWMAFKAGAWVRRKTAAGGVEDHLVLEVSEAEAKLKIETGKGKSVEAREAKEPALPAGKPLAEEKLTVGGAEIACVVVETPWGKTWRAREGRVSPLWPLKFESGTTAWTVVEIVEETLTVGGRELKCLKLRLLGEGAIKRELWLSEEVPGHVVREVQGEATLVEVMDFGTDAEKRPPLVAKKAEPVAPKEPPKPAEPPVEEVLAAAEGFLVKGTDRFKAIAPKMGNLPYDPGLLEGMLKEIQEVAAVCAKAKEVYGSVRSRVAAPDVIDEKLAKIEKLDAVLKSYENRIRSRLK